MLRELNVANPRELVKLVSQEVDGPVNRIRNQQGPGDETFSYPMFRDLELKQVGWMAGFGVPIGLAAALLIGNVAASFLFGLAPTDPVALIAAAIVLAAAVFGASYWPARRASRVDPVVALRAE